MGVWHWSFAVQAAPGFPSSVRRVVADADEDEAGGGGFVTTVPEEQPVRRMEAQMNGKKRRMDTILFFPVDIAKYK
jgi:hypothetical protein